ncbi:hypothetical protein Hypma_011202 [Hypsizygus marmoreus]|uniref:Uncharacterized protein n=1 Tax=Hypsizygus marmoreus TaxID=39966 RepID=A0A369JPK5_HYPMA|nr:hypothetical protein Hypma_011202 [Hypsizygus marmoreus]
MSKDKFPIDSAQIVGLFMASVFYGMFLVTFIGCLRVLLLSEGHRLKPLNSINYKMLIPAILMFIFGSLDVAFGLQHNIEAFIYFQGDPIDEFNNNSNWLVVMKMVNYVAQTFIGDAILLYRCWVIYSKRWLIVLVPALMWIAETVCGIMTAYIEANLKNDAALVNAKSLVPFITSMLTLTLVTNVIVTSLIVWRIWSIQRAVKFRATTVSEKSPLSRVMRILIESGLMYTMSIIVLFGLYMASNNGQFGVSNSVVQIIGITFNLIITRVDRGEATQPMSQAYRSNTGNNGNVPLHSIHIQTTISRYPDAERSDASVIESPESKASEWK